MCTSLTDAESQPAEDVHGAEPQLKIVANAKSRRAVLEEVRAAVALLNKDGPDAAQSQDFLYDDEGISI